VDVSNFPGTTVDISTGKYKGYIVMDTPEIYGVSSFNEGTIMEGIYKPFIMSVMSPFLNESSI